MASGPAVARTALPGRRGSLRAVLGRSGRQYLCISRFSSGSSRHLYNIFTPPVSLHLSLSERFEHGFSTDRPFASEPRYPSYSTRLGRPFQVRAAWRRVRPSPRRDFGRAGFSAAAASPWPCRAGRPNLSAARRGPVRRASGSAARDRVGRGPAWDARPQILRVRFVAHGP